MVTGMDEAQFLLAAEFLDGGFALTGAAAVMTIFTVNHFQRFAAIEIFGATAKIAVLPETPFQVGGNPGVQRVIVASDDVDLPVHDPWVRTSMPAGIVAPGHVPALCCRVLPAFRTRP
jgi:hypothetical protein